MSEPTIADLEALSDTLFVGPLAFWSGSLAFRDHADAVDAGVLADKGVFDDLVSRFAQSHPNADRQAVASFWSQHYLAKLTIVLTTFCLAAEQPLPLDFTTLRMRFCAEKGTPLCFHLRCDAPARPGQALVKALYEEQVAGTVAQLRRHSGLSARLFWENAGAYGMWILGEIARTRPALAPVAETLLADATWPRSGCAMLAHLKSAALRAEPARRRVCCLRYKLPGIDRCAGTCPLAAQDEEATPAETR